MKITLIYLGYFCSLAIESIPLNCPYNLGTDSASILFFLYRLLGEDAGTFADRITEVFLFRGLITGGSISIKATSFCKFYK